jgi:hypothetical protein
MKKYICHLLHMKCTAVQETPYMTVRLILIFRSIMIFVKSVKLFWLIRAANILGCVNLLLYLMK